MSTLVSAPDRFRRSRLRRQGRVRDPVAETRLDPSMLILPVFVDANVTAPSEIASLPGHARLPVRDIPRIAERASGAGIGGLLLFGLPTEKDEHGENAADPLGPVPTALRALREPSPGLVLIADVCLCEYTTHGHCGVVTREGAIDNDATLPFLAAAARVYAEAGADVVAPSDMMDGRVAAIREELDAADLPETAILAYSAKYASSFYGPFRDAADCAPRFGDRAGYQMDPRDGREALVEIAADIDERARRVMPGGVSSPVRAYGAVGGEPPFIVSAEGCHVTDADGREYVDLVSSWGAVIAGHAHPNVIAAILAQARRGTSYGAPSPLEVELAEKITASVASVEMVRFVSSGTEAVMSALRLARAATGRDGILKFAGSYHGHADALLSKAGSGLATLGLPDSAGVPAAVARDTITVPYGDLDAAAHVASATPLAAILVEPVAGNMGCVVPDRAFLVGLRTVADRTGACLIFDEVITGFRVARSGAQGLFGVRPDVSCFGKIIGGGLPVGAYGASRKLMSLVAPLGPV